MKSWCHRCHKPAMININGKQWCGDCFNRDQHKMAKKNPTPDEGSNVLLLQARIEELEREVNQNWKLLWLLANRKGGKLTFTPKELATMKDGGRISRTVDDENVVTVEAL
jgi:hypothetical protein